jgi:hypothetical protein
VVQAIPIYCMSVFLLPKTLCLEVNLLMQQFWWGYQNKFKVHWMSWSWMGLAKADGGLGYRDCLAKVMEDWAIETLGASIRPFWQNRVGGFGSNPTTSLQK